MALFVYDIGIITASLLTLHGFVMRNHKKYPNLFGVNTEDKVVNASISIFPYHWILGMEWDTKIRILKLQRELNHRLSTKATNDGQLETSDKEFIVRTFEEIDIYQRQLYKINMFYQNMNIRESLSERQFQLSIFISLNYYMEQTIN